MACGVAASFDSPQVGVLIAHPRIVAADTIRAPRPSRGPALQQELARRGSTIPIVFITAQGDATLRLRLLEAGAIECLLKPFSESALLDAVTRALRR